MLGYFSGYYERGRKPIAPWSLHLNFNKTHKSIELLPEHFESNGVSPNLLVQIEAIDPRYDVDFSQPMFEEVATRRKLSVTVDIARILADAERGIYRDTFDFFSVMKEVFGEDTPPAT